MSFDNPFYHRGAIRQDTHFLGRSAETAQILGLLRNRQSVSVIGPRRIGKSSLLIHLSRTHVREAFDLQPPHALFVLVDCQELGGSPAEEVYEAIHTGLLESAEETDIDLSWFTGSWHVSRAGSRIASRHTSRCVSCRVAR